MVPLVLLKVVIVPAVPVRFVMVPLVLLKVVIVPAVPVRFVIVPFVIVPAVPVRFVVLRVVIVPAVPVRFVMVPFIIVKLSPENEVAVAIPVTTTPLLFVSNANALTFPVKSPLMLPTNPLIAVMTPTVKIFTSEISSLRLTVMVLPKPIEVRLSPPAMVRVSLRRLISNKPESPVTVKAVPTAAVPAAVKRPLESTVNVATSVDEP